MIDLPKGINPAGWYSIKQASKFLGPTEDKFRSWKENSFKNGFPWHKVEGSVFVRPDEVIGWLDQKDTQNEDQNEDQTPTCEPLETAFSKGKGGPRCLSVKTALIV